MSEEELKNDKFYSYVTYKNNLNKSTKSNMQSLNNKIILMKKKEVWIAYILWIVPISNGLGAFWFYIHAYIKGITSIILTIFTILFLWLTWSSLRWEKLPNMFVGIDGNNNNSESIISTSTITFFIFQNIFAISGIIWWVFSGIILQDKVNKYNYQ